MDKPNYQDEVINGFFVPSLLKRAWYAQIEVLKELEKICKENNIKYFLDYGSLLGAIRHKGFIPWDDDIDVGMLREDFEKFKDIMLEKKDSEFAIECLQNRDDRDNFLMRFVSNDIFDFNGDRIEKFHGFPFIVGLDIFPYDYLPDDTRERELLSNNMRKAANVVTRYEKGIDNESIAEIENLYNFSINPTGNVANQISSAIEKSFIENASKESEYVALIFEWVKNNECKIKKIDVENVIYVDFLNIKVPVASHYDPMLYAEFGEYSKLYLDNEGHDFPFYEAQIREIKSKTNLTDESFRRYVYSNEEREVVHEDSIAKSLFDIYKVLINTLMLAYKLASSNGVNEALELLCDAQELTIKIGNIFENSIFTRRKEVVKHIEYLCDKIYCLYEAVMTSSVDISNEWIDISRSIEELGKLIQSIEKEDKKRIALIFSTKEEWKALQPIYELLKSETSNAIYPILIPYYEYTNRMEIGEQHYDIDKFTKGEFIFDYKTFDFENDVFDEIYYTDAYEQYGWGKMISPSFFSRELQKISTKIYFVQSKMIKEFESDNMRMMYTFGDYIKTPGVLNADIIIAQSDNMRKRITEIYSDFTNRKKEDVEKDIITVKQIFLKYGKEFDSHIGKNRKNIQEKALLYVNYSQLETYKNAKIEQIKNVIDENSNKKITMCIDKAIPDYLPKHDMNTYESFIQALKEYEDKKKVTIMSIEDINIDDYDEYIGDRGYLGTFFVDLNKKVYLSSFSIDKAKMI